MRRRHAQGTSVVQLFLRFLSGWANEKRRTELLDESVRNLLDLPLKLIHATIRFGHRDQRPPA